MRIRISATRMQLLALRRRQGLARRGHKLLKDKLDGLIQRFFKLKDEFIEAHDRLEPLLTEVFRKGVFGTALSFPSIFDEIEKGDVSARASSTVKNIMGVKFPEYRLETSGEPGEYSDLLSSSEFREAESGFRDLLPDLLKLASTSRSIKLMAEQIIETRRRVNALEYVLLPELDRAVSGIKMKLSELERSSQVTLLKIKEMVRAH